MTNRLALVLAACLCLAAPAQELPRPGQKETGAYLDLIDGCVKAGGLRVVKHPKTGEPTYELADRAKLRRAVAARRDRLTPVLRQTAAALWDALDEFEEGFGLAVLEEIAAASGDDLTHGFAALYGGGRGARQGRAPDTLAKFTEAERRFKAAGAAAWQATAAHEAGYAQRGSDPDAALECYRRSLGLRRQALGPEHPLVATCLTNIGAVLHRQAHYAEALAHHEAALAVRRRAFRAPHRLIAHSLNQAGMAHTFLRHYEQALACFREARENAPGPADRDLLAESVNNLGGVYEFLGDYDQAVRHFREAGDLRFALRGTLDHPEVADSLNNLGAAHLLRGDFEQSRACLEVALRVRRKLFPGGHTDTATSLNNLCVTALRQGDLDAALDYGREALAVRQSLLPPAHPDIARVWNNLGGVHERRGDDAEALAGYTKALAAWRAVFAGRPHPDLAVCLDNLGAAHQRLGNAGPAARCRGEAVAMFRRLFGAGHPDSAVALAHEGAALLGAGRAADAARVLDEAAAALRTRPAVGPAARPSADDFRALPEAVQILRLRGRAAETAATEGGGPAAWRECADAYELAAGVLGRVRAGGLEGTASRLRVGEETFDLYPRLVGARLRLWELEGDPAHLEAAVRVAEDGTARLFAEALGRSQARVYAGVRPESRREEARLLALRQSLDRRIALELERPEGKRDAESLPRLFAEVRRAEADQRALAARLEAESPEYARLMYPRPCSLAEARACLNANEVAVLFVPGEDASYAVVVDRPAAGAKDGGLAVVRLPAAGELAGLVAALAERETLGLPEEARELGARAYRALLAPLADRVAGKDLLVVPGGNLCYLPFELLVDADGRYLIEAHRVRYAPSLTTLHLLRQRKTVRPSPEAALWALGDPAYGESAPRAAGREPPPRRLLHSGAEVRAIAEALGSPESALLLGGAATKAAVLAASQRGDLGGVRYAHFACHGTLGLAEGRQPGLILGRAGGEPGGAGDTLRLDEVTGLRLAADLVVLSACETGRGQLYGGEGVDGLARGFLYAGGRGVVCSLWAVDDAGTARLMADFYRGLRAGKPAAEALREAKLRMHRGGAAPVLWAPFVLIGEG